MEQNNETKEEKKYIEILLRTVRNGYSLDVEGEGYMYRDVSSLLEGLIVHVGLGRVAETTKEEMKELLKAILDGSAMTKLQEEVNKLRKENERLDNKVKILSRENNKPKNQKFY